MADLPEEDLASSNARLSIWPKPAFSWTRRGWAAMIMAISRGPWSQPPGLGRNRHPHQDPESQLAENVRDNILKLRDFISDTTMQHGVDIRESTLNTLININLQISEGLLEGARGRAGSVTGSTSLVILVKTIRELTRMFSGGKRR